MNLQEIEGIKVCSTATHVLLRLHDRLKREQDQVFKRNGKSPKFSLLEDKMYTIRLELAWRKNRMNELAFY